MADVSTLSWVNLLLSSIWPAANTAVTKHVIDELGPRLQETLPGPLKHFRFTRFDLGRKAPELGPMEVVRQSDEHIQVELDMRYHSDVDIVIDSGSISFGVSQLLFHGRLCIALKPLIPRFPIICGLQLFFANQPKVELRFSGLAHTVNEFPGIAQKVQAAVDEFFRSSIVLPNLKSIRLTQDDEALDLTRASSHPALGVLRVRVQSAKSLAGANWSIRGGGQLSSDPFCVMRLGHNVHRTSTVFGTINPAWPASEPSAYFVVYHQDQELTVEVETQDRRGLFQRNFMNHLGRTMPLSVRTLMYRSEAKAGSDPQHATMTRHRREVLDMSMVKKGMLHMDDPVNRGVPSEVELELEWFDLAHGAGAPFARGARGLVFVELHAGSGFPVIVVQQRRRLRWRCRLADGEPVCSRPGQVVHNDPTFGLPIHHRVLRVIEQLVKRSVPVADIADIVDSDPKAVAQWIQLRQEAVAREAEKQQQLGGIDSGVVDTLEMRWHETLPLLVRRPQESHLAVELLEGDGDGRVVGQLDPIPLQPLLVAGGGSLTRETLKFYAAEGLGASGGFSAWLFPACSKPQVATGRYGQVRMDVSVRFQVLEASCGPRAVGRGGSAGGPAPSDTVSDATSTAVVGAPASSSSRSTLASRSARMASQRSCTPPTHIAEAPDESVSLFKALRNDPYATASGLPPAAAASAAAPCATHFATGLPPSAQVGSSAPFTKYGDGTSPPSPRAADPWRAGNPPSPRTSQGAAAPPLSPRLAPGSMPAVKSPRGATPAGSASGRRPTPARQPQEMPALAPAPPPPPPEPSPWSSAQIHGPPLAQAAARTAFEKFPMRAPAPPPAGPTHAGQPQSMLLMPGDSAD